VSRNTWLAACLVTLMLTAAAWAQDGSVDPVSTPVLQGGSATVADTSATGDLQQGIKEQLRSTFAQFIADEIHNLFGELRTALGLPAEPTDPATDPLTMLESAITDMVVEKLTN